MDGFVTKKARVKPRVAVVVPRPTGTRPETAVAAPSRVASPPPQTAEEAVDDVEEEDISDRDEAFDRYWEERAGKRKEVREKRKKMEAAPRTIKEHFAAKKTT